jgi:molybdopterin-guanine dinucleotide biosynthesis protein A
MALKENRMSIAQGRCGAILLAGGRSERMGRDKALLPIHGTTLLEHNIALLQTLAQEVVVVTDAPDRYQLTFGRVVADIYPDSGPVGGIVTGLRTLGEGSHLVVACDMPALDPDVLAFLQKAVTPDVDAVVPKIAGQWEPLCAVYRHTAEPRLQQFLETGGRSARQALTTLRIRRVDETALRRLDPDLRCFTNLNTPQDLAHFQQP